MCKHTNVFTLKCKEEKERKKKNFLFSLNTQEKHKSNLHTVETNTKAMAT